MRFSGHESFACRYAWLPKTLQAIEKKADIFAYDELAMVELGVGKNMVRSMRFWAEATGMIQSTENGLSPTLLGTSVFSESGLDPFLEDATTLWLLHWHIATSPSPLLAWDFLLNKWQETDFSESRVLAAMHKEVDAMDRSASPATLRQHLSIFLLTYLESRSRKGEDGEDNLDCPLTDLEFVIKVGEREATETTGKREAIYAFRREEKPSISPGLFAYCVNDFWCRRFPNEKTLPARTVAHAHGSPGQIFKIPEQDVYQRLSGIAAVTSNDIAFNESEALPQIIRGGTVRHERLLRKAYG